MQRFIFVEGVILAYGFKSYHCKLGFSTYPSEDNRVFLIGLCPLILDKEVINKIEFLINYFSCYDLLKKRVENFGKGEEEYEFVCEGLEQLRSEFKLPARFLYNKLIRRDNPHFKGRIVVSIPDEDTVDVSLESKEE